MLFLVKQTQININELYLKSKDLIKIPDEIYRRIGIAEFASFYLGRLIIDVIDWRWNLPFNPDYAIGFVMRL